MRGRRAPGMGRYHLILPVRVWKAVLAEAARRHLQPSALVREILMATLGIAEREEAEELARQEGASHVGKRHSCRLSVDGPTWDLLAREARTRRLAVAAWIRQRLREAVWDAADERKREPALGEEAMAAAGGGRAGNGGPTGIVRYEC